MMIQMDSPSCDTEVWKAIPGYEGIYEASNLGRIRTAFGKTTSCERYPVRVWKQRVLKPKVHARKNDGKKDQRVSLYKDGEDKTCLVARLVAMTFIPVPFDKLTVNHKNGNPMDNRIENLEWVTLEENIRHGFETGQYKSSQKSVELVNTKIGETIRFKSMNDASRYLGKGSGYVSNNIAKGRACYGDDGKKYWPRLVSEAREEESGSSNTGPTENSLTS